MAKEGKKVRKVQMTDVKHTIIQQLFQEYGTETAEDIQNKKYIGVENNDQEKSFINCGR